MFTMLFIWNYLFIEYLVNLFWNEYCKDRWVNEWMIWSDESNKVLKVMWIHIIINCTQTDKTFTVYIHDYIIW